jgi:uncharacterized membrane protein HdeD (DUF308 family)
MKTISNRSVSLLKPNAVSIWEIVVAGILLLGLMTLGFGFFQHNRAAFFAGLIVVLAGVIHGVIRIVTRSSR